MRSQRRAHWRGWLGLPGTHYQADDAIHRFARPPGHPIDTLGQSTFQIGALLITPLFSKLMR